MRTSVIFTVSVPPQVAVQVKRSVKKSGMTKSELIRMLLRRYFDEQSLLDEAVAVANDELRRGATKELRPGTLVK